ncbi:MAG: glycosyl transferase [Xanthomonadales bacterium]|nr:glycosyltransferase family 9 protein [Xanthomonadales bacterium]NIX12096.1 glycosyl transferase [Xanthomonadales bacterium]
MLPLERAPDSICILRLSALGDATHVVPVIRAIRRHWPETRITWIIGKLEHKLLGRLEGVEFIVFDKRGGWRSVRELRRALAGRRFDALLHMQVALRANLLSRFIAAPIRLGWNRERSRDRHYWFVNRSVADVPFQHQVPGFLEFARALGVPSEEPEWRLPVAAADREWATDMLPGDRPVLMISPCSSHILRNWSVERYAALADYAGTNLGMQVAITGGPSDLERRTGASIEAAAQHPVTNLVGKDTLPQSMALLERAAVLVSPDSGPAHIASALGTPVLGLYAATWSRRSGPWRSLDLCVDRFPEAARRFRDSEPGELRWGTRIEVPGVMDLVQLEDVLEKLDRFMSGRQAADPAG